jgi:DNA-binding CsgD family transcriptional regulator
MGCALAEVRLTERQKQACLLRLRGARPMPQHEIARRLKISQPAVHKHLRAAVQRYPTLRPLLFPSRVGQRRQTEAA